MYVWLPDGSLAHLALYQLCGVAWMVLTVLVFLEHESLYLPVLYVARPDDDKVGEGGVADPTLLAVDDPSVPVAAGRTLKHHGVRPVGGLRQAPGPDLLHPRHPGEPPSFLLLGTTDRHGPHRQPGMNPEECIEAPVPPAPSRSRRARQRPGSCLDTHTPRWRLPLCSERPPWVLARTGTRPSPNTR